MTIHACQHRRRTRCMVLVRNAEAWRDKPLRRLRSELIKLATPTA